MSLPPLAGMDVLLRRTLAACVPDLRRLCTDPWVVIGSAAAWLAGAEVTVADVDVLTSVRDARTLVNHWQSRLVTTAASKDGDRFRSHFARFDFPLAVEVMGGLELASPGGWTAVRVEAIQTVDLDGLQVPVPTIAGQIRLLESFGRPKDRERTGQLKRLQGHPA
jgi:hypothetical protein